MNGWNKLLKKLSIKRVSINIIAAIVLLISMVILYLRPNNQFAIIMACAAGGLMNMMFGFHVMKDPKKKSTGMAYVLFGLIIVGLGFYIVQYIRK
ncbi:MAG TPA: hypothetical protein VN258_04115 [Mobilitalea sp.]|nr:hypothetical protein [Mobilitalea sp.]